MRGVCENRLLSKTSNSFSMKPKNKNQFSDFIKGAVIKHQGDGMEVTEYIAPKIVFHSELVRIIWSPSLRAGFKTT